MNVILDEFDGQIQIVHLLRWLDKYPCLIETKGSGSALKATHFWITSNKPIRDWYAGANVSGVQLAALERRVEVIEMNVVYVAPARVRCLGEVIEISDSEDEVEILD
uniref:Replication-associated protein n=1 Tax=Cressdnaviricota sp. TaxID=2748378 RepID=A0A6M3YP23_9VIRU|nr:MAG: replication-associated protein [Cressdnaviricota sp.]